MRKALAAGFVAGLMAIAAPALAGPGPGGTSEGTSGASFNQVNCGSAGTKIPGTQGAYLPGAPTGANTSGDLTFCNSGSDLPIQGRIILAGSGGANGVDGYAAADGDNSNPSGATGYSRLGGHVDPSGGGVTIRCAKPEGPDGSATTTGDNDPDSANPNGTNRNSVTLTRAAYTNGTITTQHPEDCKPG